MNKIMRILGFPHKTTFAEIKKVIIKFKAILVLWCIATIFYIIFFVFLKSFVYNNLTGPGFGVSFSASFLEDLIFFIFIGLAVTIVSTIVSNKRIDEHEFKEKIVSIANSDKAKNDFFVKEYLADYFDEFTYYSKFLIEVKLLEYKDSVYKVAIKREHVITNMCNDREHKDLPNSVTIQTDLDNNGDGDYGTLHFYRSYDTKSGEYISEKYDPSDNQKLLKGLNKMSLPIELKANSEVGVEFSYTTRQKIGDREDTDNWMYFQSSKLTSDVVIKIINRISPIKKISGTLNKRSSRLNYVSSTSNFETADNEFIFNEKEFRLLPGDRIELYLNPYDS